MTQDPHNETWAAPRRVTSLHALPRAIEPPRDLWPGIDAQLDAIGADARRNAKSFRAARGPWLAAAAMLASVAVGLWVGRSVLSPEPNPVTRSAVQNSFEHREAAAALDPALALAAPTALDTAFVNDPRLLRQREGLLRSLQTQLEALPPASRARVIESLTAVRKAKEDLEAALGKDPGNALLQELLVNTYQDEMRVLTDVHTAGAAGRGI